MIMMNLFSHKPFNLTSAGCVQSFEKGVVALRTFFCTRLKQYLICRTGKELLQQFPDHTLEDCQWQCNLKCTFQGEKEVIKVELLSTR